MVYRSPLIFLIFQCCLFAGHSQQLGGNPPSVKWMQINNSSVRVIFPRGLDSTAERVANVITWLDKTTPGTIGTQKRKVNLVLQNQTTISNAYVSLAPFRSEFYLTPEINSFEIGSLPWADQLAIHEFRHVQQYNNFNVGISKLLRILFGENGQALANGAAISNWFFEGDAVYNETNVSNQGRGRIPFFYAPYRSLWQEGKNYSWLKLRNGSYKDFIPDHYALGYLLVSYGREKYGDEFWKNVTHDAAAFKGLFYPFQNAIKKYSGKNYVQFRNDALTYFKNYFSDQSWEPLHSESKEYVNEEYPTRMNDDEVVFMKSGYKKIPSFVSRSARGDAKITTRDISLDNYFSYSNGKVVFASYRPDARWGNKDYSDLRILDVSTGKEQNLTNRTKYFTPDISHDGQKVIAVQISPDGKSMLHLLNAVNGNVLSIVPNPDNLFYTYPKFYNNNSVISAVRNQKGKMSLALVNFPGGGTDYLTPFSYNVIGFPSISNDTIYFTASAGKNDHLFAFVMGSKKIFSLSSANFVGGIGSYQPSAYHHKMAFTVFTSEGFKIREESIDSLQWKELSHVAYGQTPLNFGITALSKTNADELSLVSNDRLPVSKYNKATGLLNFHSIQPGANDPEYTLALLGENILNTLSSELSVTYNRAEQWKRIGFKGIYASLFPYISAGANYTIDRRGFYHRKIIYWNELETSGGLNIVLDLSKNKYLRRLNFGSNYTYNQTDFQGTYKDSIGRISYSYLNNFIFFSNHVQKTRQQIYPSFAQTISLSYKRAVTHLRGTQFEINGAMYLPGLGVNHSLVLNGAFLQKDTTNQLNFSSSFPFSRGYSSANLYQMFKWGVTYHLPLFYPDAGIGSIVYFLRVRGNIFYDDTHVNDFYASGAKFKADFRSVGSEVYFDTKWWNQAVLTFGIRYSRLLDPDIFSGTTGNNRWELILPVNIFQQ